LTRKRSLVRVQSCRRLTCPAIAMMVESDAPLSASDVIAQCLRSWNRKPGSPAIFVSVRHAVRQLSTCLVGSRPSPRPARWPCSARSATYTAHGSDQSSSRCSAASGLAQSCPAGRTAARQEPALPSRRAAGGPRPQTGFPRSPPQNGQLTLNSTSLRRPCGCSLPSMTNPSGSSCVGIKPPLQAHLVLDKSANCFNCSKRVISIEWGALALWLVGTILFKFSDTHT